MAPYRFSLTFVSARFLSFASMDRRGRGVLLGRRPSPLVLTRATGVSPPSCPRRPSCGPDHLAGKRVHRGGTNVRSHATLDYVEEEFFVSGTASAFNAAAPLDSRRRWTATPRRRPPLHHPRAGAPAGRPGVQRHGDRRVAQRHRRGRRRARIGFHPQLLMREGFAWVGVSAQLVGVAGAGGPLGLDLSLKAVNPVRYAPLQHPGDSFSYDMFSQVAQAVRCRSGWRRSTAPTARSSPPASRSRRSGWSPT